MDYALNLHRNELHGQLMQWVSTPAAADTAKWLLVDAAMLEEKTFLRLMKGLDNTCFHNIFANSRYEIYGLQAPYLIRLDVLENTRQGALLQSLFKLTSGLPALAALDASADAAALSRCLAWFAQAHTCDGLELYCRLADTRITPGLLQVLNDEQRVKLRQLVQQWQVVNRHGAWQALLPDREAQLNVHALVAALEMTQPFILSDAQYAMLMQKAEPDAIFQLLCESNSDLVPDEERGEFHQRLEKIVERALQHGLENSPDILLFTIVALTTQDEFDQHPALKETWLSVQQKTGCFSELVAAWPDTIWGALSHPITSP